MPAPFQTNLAYAIHDRFGSRVQDKRLAEILGVDRSTISRLRNGDHKPSRERIEALSRYFGVDPQIWDLPREDFIAAYTRTANPQQRARSAAPNVTMAAIEAHRHLWQPSFDTHKGQYIAYWKAGHPQSYYVASLLEISDLTENGIAFALKNPYIRDDLAQDGARLWTYAGCVYPVADYLYFYGEQTGNSYELFSMIMTASPVTPPDLLRGCLSGIYVKDGRKQIAVTIAVILQYQRRPIADWRAEMGKKLGKLRTGQVPERIRRMIDPLPGVVPLP